MVINKPAGLAVHGGSNVPFGLIEALRVLFPEKEFLELVHRLDRDTSGLLMVSENAACCANCMNNCGRGASARPMWPCWKAT